MALLLTVAAAVFGLGAGLVVMAVGAMAGWDRAAVEIWWLASAVIWLPLAVGVSLPSLVRELGPRIMEQDKGGRLAPYLDPPHA